MSDENQQLEFDLPMAPQVLDEMMVSGTLLLDRPEVEYRVYWRAPNATKLMERFYADSIWPMDRMCGRIIAMMHSVFGQEPWDRRRVRAVLDALQSAYGCEEPF